MGGGAGAWAGGLVLLWSVFFPQQVKDNPDSVDDASDSEAGTVLQTLDAGGIYAEGQLEGFAATHYAGHDIERALSKAELIIGKQRNGPLGVEQLTFLGEFTRFESQSRRDDDYAA